MAKRKKPTLPKLKQKLQKIFNAYIRQRDSEDGWFTCISCGVTKKIEEMNAGHYFPTKGFDALRFNEDNCHGECQGCNGFDSMHLIGYDKRLQEKIGRERYMALKASAQAYKQNGHKWARHELEEMIIHYKSCLERK